MVLFVDNGRQVEVLKEALRKSGDEEAQVLLKRVIGCECHQVGKVKCADKKVRHSKEE